MDPSILRKDSDVIALSGLYLIVLVDALKIRFLPCLFVHLSLNFFMVLPIINMGPWRGVFIG